MEMSGTDLPRNIQTSEQESYITYSIQSDNENEKSALLPSLHHRKQLQIYDKIFTTILFLILLSGLLIGIYLMVTEGHERKAPGVYNLTLREHWQAHVPSSTMPKLKLPVRRVLFLQLNTTSCDSKSHCAKLLQELQLKHMLHWKEPDISYNFIMTRDGRIFEGRGWNFETSFPGYSLNNTVTLAFMGQFHTKTEALRQAEAAKLFVKMALIQRKLEPCFNISVWRQNKIFIDIARNVQSVLSECEGIT